MSDVPAGPAADQIRFPPAPAGLAFADPPELARPALPAWPLLMMFGLVPIWWAAGGFYLLWPVLGLFLAALLLVRGQVALPPGSRLWLVYLALVLLSLHQLTEAGALLVAGLRFSFYATALLVAVYVFALASRGERRERVWRPLWMFWLALVGLGWLGVLAPQLSLASPIQLLLPAGIGSQEFIQDLVRLSSTEPQSLAVNPTYRPSAPFPYTNTWGSSFAILVPCVLAYLSGVRAGALRWLLLASIPLALVPAFLTLNRGMFVSLGVGLLVVAVRSLWNGKPRRFLAIAGLLAIGWLATLAIPVTELIQDRVQQSGTNEGRRWLYEQALRGIAESPLWGHGAPRSVDIMDVPPIGTQGQLWTVAFSHGLPALLCFVGWFLVVCRVGLAGRGSQSQWLLAVPAVALTQLPFYGLTFHNLSLVFYAAGLLLADADRATITRDAGP